MRPPASTSATAPRGFFLVGPSGTGKTDVAHWIARRARGAVLSADSMAVYREMDVGTAKPTRKQREQVTYWGIDLVPPHHAFSVGAYMEHARTAYRASRARGQTLYVVGGSGLYIKSLTEGLDELPGAEPMLRERGEQVLARAGVDGLQRLVRARNPARYEALQDKSNPRRLIRALELASVPAGRSGPPPTPLIGLKMPRELLYEKIKQRVILMYASGLLDEVKRLRETYPTLSRTAAQAIGYREALSVLDGTCSLDEAIQTTALRTRQFVKRQQTWFRHQANVKWVEIGPDTAVPEIGERVCALWRQYGPTPLCV